MIFWGLICILNLWVIESKQIVGPKQVTGIVGGSITIKCFYSTLTKANKGDRKFFCREVGRRRVCDTVISTNNYVMESFRNRVSLMDSSADGVITVVMSGLQRNDEGTYRCGIGNSVNSLNAVINVALRGTVTFLCKFDIQYSSSRKYLCKLNKSGCSNIIDSTGYTANEHQGRILINMENPTYFTVKLIQLRKEDFGLYFCGVGNYGADGDPNVFDLRINEDTDIPHGTRVVTTYVGGSFSALCAYNPKKNYTLKLWCKLEDQACHPLIKTDGFVKEILEGRIVIHDNPKNGTMQVSMNQLTREDEGWYWCVMTDGTNDQISPIQVKLADEHSETLIGKKEVVASVGMQAKISCSYPCRYTSYQKYWCKWSNFGCDPVISKDNDVDSLSINCDKHDLELVFNAVAKKDEGWYWCVFAKSGQFGETLAVHLKVEDVIAKGTYINSKKMRTENVAPLINGDKLVTEDGDKANVLNNFFPSVYTIEDPSTDIIEYSSNKGIQDSSSLWLTEDMVQKELNKVNISKSPGPDKIHPRLLKELSSVLSRPLFLIFADSLMSGGVPLDWKKADVIPIFKKGSRSQPGNYRPVSLTSVVGKILESLIREHVLEYVSRTDIISSNQHGFRRNRSCQTNLLGFYEE
ncbi:hypothetical protein GDO86_003295, partial [Hymenochirus boettgeri]